MHGFVRTPAGAPVPGISVTAASASGEVVASGITDADGWYRLTGLNEGEHVLVAGGHEPVSATVEVTSGETTSVTIRVGGMAAPAAPATPATPATRPPQPHRPRRAACRRKAPRTASPRRSAPDPENERRGSV